MMIIVRRMNIPTVITAARIVFILPLVGLLLLKDNMTAAWAAFGLYILLALSDWLDGFIARRFNQQSRFGAMLDQIADKILVISLLVALAANHIISGFNILPLVIIIIREFLVSGLREYYAQINRPLPVGIWGKWKTTAQMVALGLLLWPLTSAMITMAGLGLLWIAALLAILSMLGYLKKQQS